MRPRSLVLLLALAAGIVLLRRRAPAEFVEVEYEDGSGVRLTGGPEASDLLDDAYAILTAA